MLRALLVLILLGAALAGGALYYGHHLFHAPGPADKEAVVLIEPGMGVKAIAARLAQRDLIGDGRLFSFGVQAYGADAELKAGEYAIPPQASMAEIMEILKSGQSILYQVTVPEGMSAVQVVDILQADDVLTGGIEDPPEEGRLLPETYSFTRGTTRAEILAQMRAAQDALLEDLWAERDPSVPLESPYEALILASIVEKETGIAEERPLVASVMVNRLRRGMRLQSDPTIIYPITEGRPLGRRIRRSEIDAVNDYNTYTRDGLPLTPIAMPGRESIEAVLNPPETDYLFFVADGTGGHVFAETLAEHNRNVAAYRRIQRENGER